MPKVSFGTFALEAPNDWTLSSIILAGPVEDLPGEGMLTTKTVKPFQRNLFITMEKVTPQETLESYLQRQVEGLKAAGVSRELVGEPERVALSSGQDGVVVEQVILGPGGERMRQMQLVFIKNAIAHTAIATHLDGASFERVREEFRSLLMSFE